MKSRRSTLLPLLSLLWLSLLATGCYQDVGATPQPAAVTIAGATTMLPVLETLAASFNQEHPNVLFDIRGGGSALGEERVERGEIDIAASTLMPADVPGSEGDPDTSTADLPPVRTPIGLDGIAIVVNRRNPVQALSVLQVRDLFSGHALRWSDVANAGADGENPAEGEGDAAEADLADQSQDEVLLVSREDGSGTRALFEERVMGDEMVSLTAVVMPSSGDVADYVAKHTQAIGYVSRAYVDDASSPASGSNVSAGDDLRVVALEDLLPTAETVGDQTYFLTQPLFLVTAEEPSGWTRAFIDFALSPSGQEIVDRFHARIR